MAAAARKMQIAEVAVELIAKNGVQATTVSRIAAAAGLSEPGLYRHFASRQEILLAALDFVYERIAEFLVSSQDQTVPERLRAIAQRHSSLIGSGKGTFLHAFFEFVASPPELGLRDEMAARQMAVIESFAELLEEGKVEGSIRWEVDTRLVSWELHGIFWSEDITHLMGIHHFIADGVSGRLLDRAIDRISPPSPRPAR
jgi:AcrR family transcriptional regulator